MFFEKKLSDLYIAHKYDEKPVKNKEQCHFHMSYEMILFIRGNAEFTIENRKCGLFSGNLLLTLPGQSHRIDVNPDYPFERYIIRFSDKHLPRELVSALKDRYGCFSTENTVIPRMFMNFDEHIGNYNGSYCYELIKCALEQLLYHFVSKSLPCGLITENRRIAEIIDYIDNNIGKNFTLDDICGHLNISESLICREFQKQMNTAVMAYVRRKRILLAEALLREGAKPLDIYKDCGFVNYSTFFRAYKNVLGRNPTNKNNNLSKKDYLTA